MYNRIVQYNSLAIPPNVHSQVLPMVRLLRHLASLPTEARTTILNRIADALLANSAEILRENEADIAAAQGISDSLMQRLIMKPAKIDQLAEGIRAIARMEEPVGRVLLRTEVAENLVLEQVSAPIGVLMIIFEARPDALPQIASLAIRSGNGLLLKGGKEAARTNACLHRIIASVLEPEADPRLIGLVTSRDAIDDLLKLDDCIDLVIPRGSNELVSYIKANTKIPVMGHADGICHIYVDHEADLDMACRICVDSKADYPAACNAVEKILIHMQLLASGAAQKIVDALRAANVKVNGGPLAAPALGLPPAESMRIEYSAPEVTVEIVGSMDEAIDHIHSHGSGHTESIITDNAATAEEFLRRIDSACVFHNASTRFSDGFRFGLGAEVGISTGRIHARGPVGVEGLLTTRWLLRGRGQIVDKDRAVRYTHKKLSTD